MNDIDSIRRDVSLPDLAGSMGVQLDRNGNEYEACCPFHEERTPSFTIFAGKDRAWHFHCFGCGATGDVIDFVEKLQGVSTGEAIKILVGDRAVGRNVQPVRIEARDPYAGIERLDPPRDIEPGQKLSIYNPKRDKYGSATPSLVFPYRRADGTTIGFVLRIDLAEGKKETPQVCWARLPDGKEGWTRLPFPKPRPLYGQERITAQTTQAIVVEGEKKVDAIWRATKRVAVSAPGGTNGGRYADWSALAGKKVLIWPDADPEGFGYMAELAGLLVDVAAEVKFIDVIRMADGSRGFDPEKDQRLTIDQWEAGRAVCRGWDVADAERDGWNKQHIDGFMLHCRAAELPLWPKSDPSPDPAPAPDPAPKAPSVQERKPLPMPVGPVGADAVSLLPQVQDVEHDSEVFLAQHLVAGLEHCCGDVVKADGAFWAWGPSCWREIPEPALRLAVHKFDSARLQGKKPIKIGRTTINGILNEAGTILNDTAFFHSPSVGLNAADVVIEIAKGGQVTTRPHSPDDRFRFTIPARYGNGRDDGLPEDSMLYKLVWGAFKDDPDAGEKVDLIGEILGAAAFGIATRMKQPKAFVLLGETASNGKSTIASLLECLLPEDAVSHIPPSAYEDERRIINLAGKAANVADELSANAISGETFKAAVTGNAIEGRDLYRSAVTFVPRAIHVFTTNTLPRFHGGLDKGLQRRLVVIRFNRPIPEDEIIEDIADRIRHDELDLLLRFAIEGAQRLFSRGSYTVPSSSREALAGWLRMDPVVEWFEECIAETQIEPIGGWKKTSELYKHFKTFAIEQGHAEKFLPPVNTFSQRIKVMPGVILKKRSGGMTATGIKIADLGGIEPGRASDPDLPW